MRILHVLGKLDYGGVETWLVQVLRHIDRQKYQMDFLVHTTDPGMYDEEVRALGARIIPCLGPSNPLRYALNFRRALGEYGPYDVVHSHVHHYSGYVLMLAAMMGVKVRIAHSHNDTANIDRHGSLARSAYLKITKVLVKRTSTLGIAASKMAGDCLFPSVWESSPKWQLAPYGVDFTPFDVSIDRAEVRRQLGIPPDSIVVGHVGRFVPQKNHALFVNIAARFAELEPHAFFLMVGGGPLRAEVELDVNARGLAQRFLFTGVRSDIPSLLKGAVDLFLFPSLYEGLGIVVLEAQLAGLPCLLSDAVPREADMFPELVTRLSLAALPTEWASGLFDLRKKVGVIPRERYMKARAVRSIESSVESLTSAYQRTERYAQATGRFS